jgi:L-ascorbate metabolism protein UlaG (beta-lactamase superfamily)
MMHNRGVAAFMALVAGSIAFASTAFAGDEGHSGDSQGHFGDSRGVGDPRFTPASREAACNTRTMAAAGGPTLKDDKTLLIRWMGYTNYELVYGDKIILLDNGYYNRTGTQYKDLGFTAADIKRADLIIIGHAHLDHISDTAQVAKQTHAPVIGAPITISTLASQGLSPSQQKMVTGTTPGEVLNFPNIGITVQPILGLHGQPPQYTAAFGTAYKAAAPAPTPSEAAAFAALGARGSTDPNIITQGEIAYVITFDDGFRVAFRDSGGFMTSYETNAMQKIGRVDVLLGAVAADIIAEAQAMVLLPMLKTYQPAVWIPGHHEEEIGGKPDRATEPLFQYAKNAFPDLITVSKEFREPTCFDTRSTIAKGYRRENILSGSVPTNVNLQDWNTPGAY